MNTWLTLSPKEHQHIGYTPFRNYFFAQCDPHAPILQAEVADAIAYYPLCFIQASTEHTTDSGYQLVALQSLTPGLNLYVDHSGKWLAPYVPAYYRSHPFRLNALGQLQIDTQSHCYQTEPTDEDSAVFTAEGDYSPAVEKIHNFLTQCAKNAQHTQELINQLNKQGLITPWELQTKQSQDSEPQSIHGYYRIDEEKLKQLPGIQLSLFAQTGALALAYQQLTSLKRLQDFRTRYACYQEPSQLYEVDLDQVFGEASNDAFKF